MKILHLVQSADTSIGGSLTVARELKKAQCEIGLDAWLLTLYESTSKNADDKKRFHEINCSSNRQSRWINGLRRLRILIQNEKPDILHHHDGILWPRIASAGLGIPKITHGHLGAPEKNITSAAWWIHLATIATTNRLIAVSTWVAESWGKSGMNAAKIDVLPNGVDTHRFFRRPDSVRKSTRDQYGILPPEKILLWVGRFDNYIKGLDRLIKIAAHLPDSVRLMILGSGPGESFLNEAIKELPISKRPLLTGPIDDPSLLYGCADAFLFTSRVETFGLVLLEAASSGLPIYAFPCEGGGSETLRRLNAVIFNDERDNLSDFSRRIEDDLRYPTIKHQSFIQSEYSWGKIATATKGIYDQIDR